MSFFLSYVYYTAATAFSPNKISLKHLQIVLTLTSQCCRRKVDSFATNKLIDPQEGHTGDQLDHSQPDIETTHKYLHKCYYLTANLTGRTSYNKK